MKRSYSAQHYLTFEWSEGYVTDLPPEAWSKHAGDVLETIGMVEPGTYRLLPGRLWEVDLREAAARADNVGNRKRICRVSFDKVPEQFWPDINSGKHKAVHKLSAIGTDLPIHITDFWNPAESIDPIFSTRKVAHQLMNISEEEKPGIGANVVIVDQGLNQDYIRHLGGDFMGGWHLVGAPQPGNYDLGHGSMLARNILKVAPEAKIYDLPVVPDNINDSEKFLSTVHAAFNQVLKTIDHLEKNGEEQARRPWVFVNAWATYNTGGEQPSGDYTTGVDHKFNRLITDMAKRFDLVFAAGNCGQFCPSRRCGANDVGPGNSILGANSHPDVLTVGAVRADGIWLGYSSQGPGALSEKKPDLCAASQFCEDDDAAAVNTGTSAACAIAAGVVAALRSRCRTKDVSPAELKEILVKTTTATPTSGAWDNQIGHGIINAAAALEGVRSLVATGDRCGL